MMNILRFLFCREGENQASWRKILTALTALVFVFSCIGYQFGLPQLPKSYQALIGVVFTFYFTKELIDNIKINPK